MTPSHSTLSQQEKLDRIRLYRSENVGPVTFRHLLARYGSAAKALAALPDLAARGGRGKPLRLASAAEAEREWRAVEAMGGQMLFDGEATFPLPLSAVDDAPPFLSVIGHPHLLKKPCVALVGARNASLNGRRIAEDIARGLGAAGFVVVSGLAKGIDGAAHHGAMSSGTVAVVAGGADVVYPAEHDRLHAQIAAQGAIVAEMPPGTVPQARHFPRRNRIIAGLSRGVLVVEAALKSGSLITARFAADQGREVMAVPGSPLDPRAKGCNDLIRNGAALIESAADVLAALERGREPSLFERRPDSGPSAPPADFDARETARARALLLEALGHAPTPLDLLVRETGLPVALIQATLLEMELAGLVARHPGGQIVRIDFA